MRIAVLDYGAGNLHSLLRAASTDGVDVSLETSAKRCVDADALILPGVGGFGPAAARIADERACLRDAIARGLPTIGICLGLQLLFDWSEEDTGDGLGVLPGRVTRVRAARVPHIGWNTLDDARDPLLPNASVPRFAYFANGYACRPDDVACVTAWTTHDGDRFPAIVRRGRVMGFQFHPEKSGREGVALLRAAIAEVLT